MQFHQNEPNETSFTHSGAVVQFVSAQCTFCSIKTNQTKKEQKPSRVDFSRTGTGEPGNEVLHSQTSLSPASHTSSQICAHTHVGSNISVPYCFVKLRVTVVALEASQGLRRGHSVVSASSTMTVMPVHRSRICCREFLGKKQQN